MTRRKKRPVAAKAAAIDSPAASPAILRRLDTWLAGRRVLILAVIVAISLLVRILYYIEVGGGPLGVWHRLDETDMHYFDGYGEIAAGDWLSQNVAPPLHAWHVEVAEDYFRAHPEEFARLQPAAAGMVDEFFAKHSEAGTILEQLSALQTEHHLTLNPQELAAIRQRIVASSLLWDEWGGQKHFYQEPLYAYLIALTYKAAGPDVRYVFLWQLLLGVLSNVLIYLIARRYFGETTGFMAGSLAVLCSPPLYFEMVLLRESLVVFTGLLLVWVAGTAAQRRSAGWWMMTGVAMGLSLTLKSHFAIFVLGTLLLLAVQCRKALKDLVRLEAAAIVGIVIALTPLVARNVAVGVSPLALAGNGGVTFILGNANEPEISVFCHRMRHVAKIIGQTNGRLLPTVVATLKTYGDAGSYFKVLWDKFDAAWHWFEPPGNTNFYYYRFRAAVLRWLPVTFLILSPLALMGLILGIRRLWNWRSADPMQRTWCAAPHLYLLVLANLAVLLVFLASDRYRAPLTAALIPLAALALATAIEWLCGGRLARGGIIVGGVVLLAFWTARPLPKNVRLIRPADDIASYQVYYYPMAEQAEQAGDYLKAAELLASALKFEPEIVRCLGPARQANGLVEIAMGQFYANVHDRCARDYHLAGREPESLRERHRATELTSSSRDR